MVDQFPDGPLRSSHPAAGSAGTLIASSRCLRGPAVRDEQHPRLAHPKAGIARSVSGMDACRMTSDFNVAVAVKEHPVALVAGAVYPGGQGAIPRKAAEVSTLEI